MSQIHFSVVSALLYPFSLLVATLSLALWLSQYKEYREFIRSGSGVAWKRDGAIGGAILVILSLISFRPASHLLTIFGYMAGLRAANLASLLLSAIMLVTGWPLPCAALSWCGGIFGGLLHRWRSGRWLAILSAGVWPPVCWWAGWIPKVFEWHLRALSPAQMPFMMGAVALVSILHSWLTLTLLEYLAQRESQRMGEGLRKFTELLDPVLRSLRRPPPNEEFCQAMSVALEAPCFGLTADLELLNQGLEKVRLEVAQGMTCALTRKEPFVALSTEVFANVEANFPAQTVVLPLHDGDQALGALLVPAEPSHPLASTDPAMRKALAALVSGELNSHRLLRQQALLDETHYKMLAAQIQPHFLFNSLTSVAAFALSQPEKAHDLIVDLAHSLRPRFASEQSWIPLSEALETVRSYMAVEQARFGENLQFNAVVSEELLDCLLPPMILQPLVENAVRHGLEGRSGQGRIELAVNPKGDAMEIQIKDDGVGFSLQSSTKGHGVGLSNVRQRLRSLFGDQHQLQIISSPNNGCEIRLLLPRSVNPSEATTAPGEPAASPLDRPTAVAVSDAGSQVHPESVQG